MSWKRRETAINVAREPDREDDDEEDRPYVRSRISLTNAWQFAKWPTRRKTLQSFMICSLGFHKLLEFSAALTVYGGVIWVSYFTWMIIIGAPLVTAEIALGRYVNEEITNVWRMVPIGMGVFYIFLFITAIKLVFSNIFIVYLMHYFISSRMSRLPWSKCIRSDAERNSNGNASNVSARKICPLVNEDYCSAPEFGVSSLDYWRYQVEKNPTLSEVEGSEAGPLTYLFIIFVISILINCKGIKSLEKFTTFLVVVPYLCSVTFLIVTISLPGSVDHIQRNWKWEWSKLQEFTVWLISFDQMLGGFALGSLLLSFISIHSDFEDDIMTDLVIMFLTGISTTFVTSLTILGLLASPNDDTSKVPIARFLADYLAIVLWITEGLEHLPPPKELWSFIFFVYLITVGIGIHCLQVTCITDTLTSLFPPLKTNLFYITCGVCVIYFITGVPFIYTKFINFPVIDTSSMITVLVEAVTLFWIYSYNKVCADFHFLMGYKPSLYYQITWIMSPLFIAAMLGSREYFQFSNDLAGKISLIFPIVTIAIYATCILNEVIKLWRKRMSLNIFKYNSSWGPHDPLLQKSRIVFQSRVITKEHIYRQHLYKRHLKKPFDISEQNIVQLS